MRFDRFVMRANLIGLGVLLAICLLMAGFAAMEAWKFHSSANDYPGPGLERSAGGPTGEIFDVPQGKITVYTSSGDNAEAVHDVRLIDMQSGAQASLAADPHANVYGTMNVGSLGYIGLVQTGQRDQRPVFDFVLVRFSDMSRHKLASGLDALDAMTLLDASSFSAILWFTRKDARFVVVNVDGPKIVVSRKLEFGEEGKEISGRAQIGSREALAPRNKFE